MIWLFFQFGRMSGYLLVSGIRQVKFGIRPDTGYKKKAGLSGLIFGRAEIR
jgi:hypothetical protein